jgi:hypothetical protein
MFALIEEHLWHFKMYMDCMILHHKFGHVSFVIIWFAYIVRLKKIGFYVMCHYRGHIERLTNQCDCA